MTQATRKTLERVWFESGFRRSRKGNLWRPYEGLVLAIYRCSYSGGYGWSIATSYLTPDVPPVQP
jgi:hypothetical protein